MQPRMIVVMGERALETPERARGLPLADAARAEPGEIQRLTPTIEALCVPDIDDSLDSEELEARVLVAPSACSATGTPTCRPTERPAGSGTAVLGGRRSCRAALDPTEAPAPRSAGCRRGLASGLRGPAAWTSD